MLREYLQCPASTNLQHDSKLNVALDLYAAYFNESSPNARFLTLVMALETLAVATLRPQAVLNLVKKWEQEIERLTPSLSENEKTALEALSRELFFRKENSIRSQIRELVLSTLEEAGNQDAKETAKAALKIYDHRSKLVHDGKLDSQILADATVEAKLIVELVLKARFKNPFNTLTGTNNPT